MTTGPSRCIYALRLADRPGCQLTATVTNGGIALCTACDTQRSTLGKGQTRHRLPDSEPDPIALLDNACCHLIDAHEQLQAAVIFSRGQPSSEAAPLTAELRAGLACRV